MTTEAIATIEPSVTDNFIREGEGDAMEANAEKEGTIRAIAISSSVVASK